MIASLAGAFAALAVVAGAAGLAMVSPVSYRPIAGSLLPHAPTRVVGSHVGGRRADRARARLRERQVPQLLDLLATGSSAGMSAELSLRRAAETLGGPLGTDLIELFGRGDLGARWRDELGAYAARSGSPDLRRTVAVLRRTDELGASLVEATCDLADSVRHARRAATLERARTAPVKMLFPLVFLILPAFLLLTVVPVLLTTVRSIR